MTKKEKAKIICKILDKLYPNPKIFLDHSDVFTLLVAVVLSAQATDKKVNEITKTLFKKASTPKDFVKIDLHELENIIKPIGLYKTKAKALKNLSKIILEKYNGKVPDTFEDLESLSGVGHKTASVVMIQGFNKDAFPVDTHIHRLSKRWGLTNGKTVKTTEKDLKEIFPKKSWKKLHLQFILFGREFCKAKSHKKENCPICKLF
ncbi:MAG: endonuclease III [Chlamydiae bacterium RIFCSPHIGHO2_12_FULL_27_8]|nr:MAG: endonuclease III [Chlamydiae bacterium RIFCSPHIGHO2_12_FULL_27_8]